LNKIKSNFGVKVNSPSLNPVGRTSGTVTVKKVNCLRVSVYSSFTLEKNKNKNADLLRSEIRPIFVFDGKA
jgi:hypothetical protein